MFVTLFGQKADCVRNQSSYVETLERRLKYLQDKLTTTKLGTAKVNFVRAEIAALTWCLPILKTKLTNDRNAKGF